MRGGPTKGQVLNTSPSHFVQSPKSRGVAEERAAASPRRRPRLRRRESRGFAAQTRGFAALCPGSQHSAREYAIPIGKLFPKAGLAADLVFEPRIF